MPIGMLLGALLLVTASVPSAQSPADVVARLHGQAIIRADAPTGEVLLGKVLRRLLDDFAKEKRIEVSRDELERYNTTFSERMELRREEWRRRLIALRRVVSDPDSGSIQKSDAEREIKTLDQLLTSPERRRLSDAEERALEIARNETRTMLLRNFKINQALWAVYHGRAVFQQLGPEPLDAYRALLLEHQKKGSLSIRDQAIEKELWASLSDERHSFLSEAATLDLMTTEWWLRPDPAEGESTQAASGPQIRVQGPRLVWNGVLTITPPSEGDWLTITENISENLKRFVWVSSDQKERYSVIIASENDSSAEAFARHLVAESTRNASANGARVHSAQVSASDLPVSGGSRYSYATRPKTYPGPVHTFGYVWGDKVKIAIETWAEASDEPAALRRFVAGVEVE
jgi:hypothetical protein